MLDAIVSERCCHSPRAWPLSPNTLSSTVLTMPMIDSPQGCLLAESHEQVVCHARKTAWRGHLARYTPVQCEAPRQDTGAARTESRRHGAAGKAVNLLTAASVRAPSWPTDQAGI